jgi:hypothetical protein
VRVDRRKLRQFLCILNGRLQVWWHGRLARCLWGS